MVEENIWMWGLIERITVGEFDFLHFELSISGLITAILILLLFLIIYLNLKVI